MDVDSDKLFNIGLTLIVLSTGRTLEEVLDVIVKPDFTDLPKAIAQPIEQDQKETKGKRTSMLQLTKARVAWLAKLPNSPFNPYDAQFIRNIAKQKGPVSVPQSCLIREKCLKHFDSPALKEINLYFAATLCSEDMLT